MNWNLRQRAKFSGVFLHWYPHNRSHRHASALGLIDKYKPQYCAQIVEDYGSPVLNICLQNRFIILRWMLVRSDPGNVGRGRCEHSQMVTVKMCSPQLSQRQSYKVCNFLPFIFSIEFGQAFSWQTKHTHTYTHKCWPPCSFQTFSQLLTGSLQAKCVNSPLHYFQVKNAKENLEQFSTSLKMLEMFALEL